VAAGLLHRRGPGCLFESLASAAFEDGCSGIVPVIVLRLVDAGTGRGELLLGKISLRNDSFRWIGSFLKSVN